MDSISKVLKNTIIQSMEDHLVYSNSQLKENIYQLAGMQYGIDYKESHFAGCLTALRNKKLIEQVERENIGKSILLLPQNPPYPAQKTHVLVLFLRIKHCLLMMQKEKILFSIQQEIRYINDITKNISLDFQTADKEYHNIQEIKKLIQFYRILHLIK